MNQFCNLCHNEGIILEEDTARFCSCPAGEKAKKNWEAYGERLKADAIRYRKKRARQLRDYKSRAAGEGEEEVPF